MRYIFIYILSFWGQTAYGQFSTYYGTYNVNNKSQITANINVSGNVNKTITSIDYGSLALANAENEKIRLQSLQYSNETEKLRAIEIATNPMKAFDYGYENLYQFKKQEAQSYGFDKLTMYHKTPHNSLFTSVEATQGGYSYRNVSDNNIVTEIELQGIMNINGLKNGPLKDSLTVWYQLLLDDPEEFAQVNNLKEGTEVRKNTFLHKKEIKKAKVFGIDGFKTTLVFEDGYELTIEDNYSASINGIIFLATVRYKGEKGEVGFEQLEGRRYYLKKLCDQIIATSKFPVVK